VTVSSCRILGAVPSPLSAAAAPCMHHERRYKKSANASGARRNGRGPGEHPRKPAGHVCCVHSYGYFLHLFAFGWGAAMRCLRSDAPRPAPTTGIRVYILGPPAATDRRRHRHSPAVCDRFTREAR
jgi:hypothetical protein